MKNRKPPTKRYASRNPNTLFDISDEMKSILAELTDAQYERDHERIEELTNELIEIIEMHSNKYEATVHVIKDAINTAKGNQEIADQFQAKATANNNLAKRLKTKLLEDMKMHGLTKVVAGIFSVRTQKNSVPTLTVNVPPEELPEQFQKVEADNDELRAALSSGTEVKGVTLVKGEHIRITGGVK